MSALEDLVGKMTLAELARRAGTSVEQIVALTFGGARRNGDQKSRPPTTAGARPKLRHGDLSLEEVVAVLSSARGPVASSDLQRKLGGTPNQVRAALKQLAAAGKVKISGKRRGTRYTLR